MSLVDWCRSLTECRRLSLDIVDDIVEENSTKIISFGVKINKVSCHKPQVSVIAEMSLSKPWSVVIDWGCNCGRNVLQGIAASVEKRKVFNRDVRSQTGGVVERRFDDRG